jgi:hypothetical protein
MSKFTYLAQRYIATAVTESSGLRMGFDIEADGLLDTATKVHCVVVANLDSDQIDQYGSEQIPTALEHLSRAAYLAGHNVTGFDLPLLQRLHDWGTAAEHNHPRYAGRRPINPAAHRRSGRSSSGHG